nr:uncharacterized protein LOC120099175 [Rattus norvegicus]
MGQSLTTPLSLTLDHWKDVRDRADEQGVEIKKGKWQTLCTSEWPTFGAGWPVDGTFNKTVILQVKDQIFHKGLHGHPDQVPYIITWESLAFEPPSWVQPFVDLSWPPTPSAPLAPLSTPSSLFPVRTKKESPKTTSKPKPVLPEDSNSPLIDLLSEEPPPYPVSTRSPQEAEARSSALPEAEPQSEAASSPIAGRLRHKRETVPDSTSQAFPLRQGTGGQTQYWPFSAADIYNWKQHNPPFSKDPVALTELIESVLLTHQPTWDDCQQLLQALLTSEEKQRVFLEARKHVLGDDGRPTQLPDALDDAFPLTRPNWDFNTVDGRGHLRLYRQLLLAGLRGAARRPTNLAQVKQVLQGADETPSAFLERLKEAYRMYTPYDPDDPGQMTSGGQGQEPPPEPRITLEVGGQPVTFLVDTGAQHSVLTRAHGQLSDRTAWVQGATGGKTYRWTTDRRVQLATGKVTHSFLHVPDCPYPLLGRDLLAKLKAQIHFEEGGARITGPQGTPLQVLTLQLEDEYRLYEPGHDKPQTTEIDSWVTKFPLAWAETGGMGLALQQPPLIIQLKATAVPVSIKQYPMSQEAYQGIRPHIRRLLDQGILVPCRSPWNTPLLPVKKPGTGDYRPVQDLREVNKRVEDIHLTVPNPYNLLSTLPPTHTWYTVLDLKDAFFCLRLSPESQPLFAFEWKDPDLGLSGQLTWTRLPQGFKNSPTLFDEALHRDLADFRVQYPSLILLQYVDDLLLAGATERACRLGTESLLQTLGRLGYRASAKKAQICQTQVTYLGYQLRDGQRWLTSARKQTVAGIPVPKSPRQLREFLGTAGFCRLWIPGYAEMAAPVYPLTKQGTLFQWGSQQQEAFDNIKRALLSSPALGLPDVTKPFELFVDEKKGYAKGVLTQRLGPWKRPVAYLSKKLDPVASGWPPCLRMVAAIALLTKDANKLTLGQPLTILAPHAVEALIKQPPDRWLSNSRMTHYQAMLLNTEKVQFGPVVALNPATLLPLPEGAEPHDCLQILAETHGTRPDLMDQPLPNADYTWYTDGCSYVADGERRAGAAITTEDEVIWASALPAGTSAQRAELIALTQALKMAEGKRLNVYTDSRYAFATAHIHGEIYRRQGLLTSEGREIKNKAEILALLRALFLPKGLSIIYCPGHQKGQSPEARGNRLADASARKAAEKGQILTLVSADDHEQVSPWPYDSEDINLLKKMGAVYSPRLKRWVYKEKIVMPTKLTFELISYLHKLTHLGIKKMRTLLEREEVGLYLLGQGQALREATENCKACAQVNPGKDGSRPFPPNMRLQK